MDVRHDAGTAKAFPANAELHLRGKRLQLSAVPTPVTPHWNARLAFWANAHG